MPRPERIRLKEQAIAGGVEPTEGETETPPPEPKLPLTRRERYRCYRPSCQPLSNVVQYDSG